MNAELTIALAGNPNAGKTTLFNALTGLKQKVANYPGVTVERKTGAWTVDGDAAMLVDLPGLYSLDTTSIDEQIAGDVLRGKAAGIARPDVVVAVVDATNLERNLYLVTQILEFGIPVVIALTMIDQFERQKHQIDILKLTTKLGVPVIAIDVKENRGLDELATAVTQVVGKTQTNPVALTEEESTTDNAKIFARYNFINEAVQSAVIHKDRDAHRLSEKIDRILTHKVFGLVVLIGVLLLILQTIFTWATIPMDLLESGFGALQDLVRASMSEGMLTDLMVDGIIAGVGGVLIFLPQILLLFLFISVLEDSGYMARAAFLMDKLMSRVGLHGKAFLPLISSFACAIPGIMATRTIENQRDRFATIMVAPFMSCSARLPVYTLMIATFFAGQTVFGFLSLGAVLMLAMYALGIIVAVIVAWLLKSTILKAPPPPFIMELPPYRMPNLRTVLTNMLDRSWQFVKRAGTVILAISIILWALMYFPRSSEPSAVSSEQTRQGSPPYKGGVDAASADGVVLSPAQSQPEESKNGAQLRNSYAGKLGHLIEPAIAPLGFDWKIGVALIASFAAREVLVSTLSIIYNVGKDANEESESLITAIRNEKKADGTPVWTPLTALTLMVFFVLAMQCMSTIAVVRRETNSWRWPIFMTVYMTGLAYVAALLTYQIGKFFV